jgi:hypothetical protein
MIKRIWLNPPLAFARVGGSKHPCENFCWGPDDLAPEGTARTTIVPMKSLRVEKDGSVTSYDPPDPFTFKDGDAFRPVCPFFELHGEWTINGKECRGRLTSDVLEAFGISLKDLTWRVNVFNLKTFYLTRSPGDRIEASVKIGGDSHDSQSLDGKSPADAEAPLVPKDVRIPLGSVQVIRPTDAFPELRLRFTPPAGKVYAPVDINERLKEIPQLKPEVPAAPANAPAAVAAPNPLAGLNDYLVKQNEVWKKFRLSPEQCVLNPVAAWPKYTLVTFDSLIKQLGRLLPHLLELDALRNPGDGSELIRMLLGPRADVGALPPSIFAFAIDEARNFVSVGMIDDTGDGTISVELPGKGDQPARTAMARVVIAPPCFSPDRRLPISIADGLIDRVDRKSVRGPGWVNGDNWDKADAEVADMLDRAYETAGLQNIDALADFARHQNRVHAIRQGKPLTEEEADEKLWHGKKLLTVEPLPLTGVALQRHRRNTARQVFEMFALETKHWFERTMREPAGSERFYDKRMPGLMCGFDRRPLHLTRRQYELLQAWSKRGPRPPKQPKQ